MKQLKERILRDGKCFDGGVLKVDNFINHQMDPVLMREMAKELVKRFSDHTITKVMTIEASGIAPAIMVGDYLNVPVLFAKKKKPSTIRDQLSTRNLRGYQVSCPILSLAWDKCIMGSLAKDGLTFPHR